MDFTHELVQLIEFSPNRLHAFDSLRKDAVIRGESSPSLSTLCPTRWTVRHAAVNSILLNYEIPLQTLEEVEKEGDEYAAKAHGFRVQTDSFDTYFGLKLGHLIFSASEQLSINLQAQNITIQEATCGAELLVSHLQSLRTEAQFNVFYDLVVVQSSSLTNEPNPPRNKKFPRRLDEGHCPHRYLSPKDKYRHDYFETLELAVGEIMRFRKSDI